MIVVWLFIVAAICMVIGHIFKAKRWGLYISVYEEPSEPNLLNALTFGHTLNAIFPFRIGDIVRAVWAGRKVKNGYSFAFATVIADLYVDLITVGAMFLGLVIIGKRGERLQETAYFYMMIFLIFIPATLFCVVFRKSIKKAIRMVTAVFNEKIEYRVLYASYLCIASVKDIATKISKIKFLLLSVGIWVSYIASYIIFAESVQRLGFFYTTSDVFSVLFSGSSLYTIEKELMPFWGAYLILPLFICWIISLVPGRKNTTSAAYKHALPLMSAADRLAFLKTYYEDENREHIQAYLGLNSDVTVVEDNSAGSNASTVLVMKPDGELLYRKYAFDEDGEKLQEQINWIGQHQSNIPLPIVVDQRRGNNYVTYDMHNYGSAMGLFRYIHTMPIDKSWSILKQALEDIRNGLHNKNEKAADREAVKKYIESKVQNNIKNMIESDKYIRQLEQYNEIIVNGVSLRTMAFYSDMLDREHLTSVFSKDMYSDIHGDLTIENIVCLGDSSEINELEYSNKIKPEEYYFIDPNTGNLHNSPFLDYGKLLQSLHGNYEFLMMVKSVKIDKDKVSYLLTKSEAYGKIYERYKEYLEERFSASQVLSIYYHEIIHWLRLMPYKIRRDKKMAVVFYTGLLSVLNDVWEMENGNKK